MIRKVLKEMRPDNEIQCLGRGKQALWQKLN
jgi:hypothetical protein